jgi:glutathione S-transferase
MAASETLKGRLSAPLTLYTADRCPYAARVRITLAEKGIAYDSVEIDLRDRPAFMFEKNPTGTVPVLEQDDGFVLPESRAIMEYLEECFPEPALLPEDVRERARVRLALDQFERFSSAYYAWRYRNGPAETLQEQLARLDQRLESRPYLVGSQLTLADIGYLPWILRAEQRGVPVRRLERIAAWLVRLSGRASVATEIRTVEALPRAGTDTADLGFWRASRERDGAAAST